MICGIGTDICDISRIQAVYAKFGVRFTAKVLSDHDAKEAFAKACGTGFSDGLTFKDISILNNKKGAPEVVLSDKIARADRKVFVSLSDEKGYALAFVVIEQCTHNFENESISSA